MLFIGHYQQRIPRRLSEGRWSRVNIFIFTCQLAMYVYAIITIKGVTDGAINASMGGARMELKPFESDIIDWCGHSKVSPTVEGKDVDATSFELSRETQSYSITSNNRYGMVWWGRLMGAILTALVWTGVTLFISLVNKIWFEWGRHAIRIRSFVIHQNITVTTQFVCTIFAFITIAAADKEAKLLQGWLHQCNPYYGGLNDPYNVLPNIPLYVAVIIDAAYQFFSFVAWFYYGRKSCHLDYEIVNIGGGDGDDENGGELRVNKRLTGVCINGNPSKRDRQYIEAHMEALRNEAATAMLPSVTLDQGVVGALAAEDEEASRRRRGAASAGVSTHATPRATPMPAGAFSGGLGANNQVGNAGGYGGGRYAVGTNTAAYAADGQQRPAFYNNTVNVDANAAGSFPIRRDRGHRRPRQA